MASMLIFNLTTCGRPYLYKALDAAQIKNDLLKTLQKGVGGLVEKLSPAYLKEAKIVIHPMFKENEKWAIAEKLLFNQYAKVYVNENGANACCGNMAVIVRNPAFRIGGAPHLWGEILVCISENNYKKICDKPLEFWADETEEDEEDEEDDDEFKDANEGEGETRTKTGKCCLCEGQYDWYGNNAYPLAEGICCNDCNVKVIDERLGFKFSELPMTTDYMTITKRNKNEFVFNNGNSKFIANYNEAGYLASAEFWERGQRKPTEIDAILVRKIDDETGKCRMKLVGKDYVLIDDEAVVCDYDRDWYGNGEIE